MKILSFFDEHVIALRHRCDTYGTSTNGDSFYLEKGAKSPANPWGKGFIRNV